MIVGSIVLAGGASSRMGFPKAWLPFGPVPVLTRVVQILARFTNPVVIVRSDPGQILPPLSPEFDVIEDRASGRGPLEGLRAGIAHIRPFCDAVFATACDNPFVSGTYIEWLAQQLAGHDVAVPFIDGVQQTLAAMYSVSVLPRIEELLAQDRLKPAELFSLVRTRKLTEAEVRGVDPDLRAFTTMNTPAEYQAALSLAGLPVTPVPTKVPGT